tara:strand:- start:4354 stop:5211 length:858 start_codon:yes stop_codon:yes gene_type:complete
MNGVKNLVSQRVNSTGTGDVTLGSAIPGFVPFTQAFNDGDEVFYSIRDGNNREVGKGTYVSGDSSITRNTVFASLEGGVYAEFPVIPLNTTTNAVVTCSASIESLTYNKAVWKKVFSTSGETLGGYSTGLVSYIELATGTGIKVPGFATAADEIYPVNINMGHDITETVNLSMQAHVIAEGSAAGTVRLQLETLTVKPGEVLGSVVTQVKDFAVDATQGTHQIFNFNTDLSVGPGAVVRGILTRVGTHANDNYAGNLLLTGFAGAYQSELLGTPGIDIGGYFNWS